MNTRKYWNNMSEADFRQPGLRSLSSSPADCATEPPEESPPLFDWTPLVNISEDHQGYLITVELPDVPKREITVTVAEGTLTIAGTHRFEPAREERKYLRVERYYGRFVRHFQLPEDANSAKLTTALQGGVLTVTLAKGKPGRLVTPRPGLRMQTGRAGGGVAPLL